MVIRNQAYISPSGPPRARSPADIYTRVGKENIFRMVSDFCKALELSSIRPLFPEDIQHVSKKPADEQARQVWLNCFKEVLEGPDKKYQFLPSFTQFLEQLSAWMVNTQELKT